jgi:uncharacterized protein
MPAAFLEQNTGERATDLSGLTQAVEIGNITEFNALLEAGADANTTNESGMTVLMRAVANGHLEMARLLLEHGAEINARRSDGFNAFLLAVFFGRSDLVRFLIERGADIEATTKVGASAEAWGSARGFPEIVELLRKTRVEKQNSITPPDEVVVDAEEAIETRSIRTIASTPRLANYSPATQSDRLIDSTDPRSNELVSEDDERSTIGLALATLADMTSTGPRLAAVTFCAMVLCGITTFSIIEMTKPLPQSSVVIQPIAAAPLSRGVPALRIAERVPATEMPSTVKPSAFTSAEPFTPSSKRTQPKKAQTVAEKIPAGPAMRSNPIVESQAEDSQSSLSSPPTASEASTSLVSGASTSSGSRSQPKPGPATSDVNRRSTVAPSVVRDGANQKTSDASIVLVGGTSQPKKKVIQWP